MQDRRKFLKIAGTAIGGFILLPEFLVAMPKSERELAIGAEDLDQILIVIQLNGGNDGLNTFIPYGNEAYYTLRSGLAIPKAEVLKVNQSMGWHPGMKGFADIFQDGNASVIQNVGYPNPDRSHFRSSEIWETASNSHEYLSSGWIGRHLDATCDDKDILGAVNIDSIDSLALQGKNAHSISFRNPEQFEKQIKGMNALENTTDINPNLAYVKKLAVSAFEGSDQIKQALKKSQGFDVKYPDTAIGKNLSWISRMIKGDLQTKVYYTSLGGFDTHANQLNTHKNKLIQLSDSVKALYDDLKASNLIDRTSILIFSEFGRRVIPNASKGTDHGKAAPVFLIGGKNKGKIIGKNPDLINLSQGDLSFTTDFREIYAGILKNKFKSNLKGTGLESFKDIHLF
jgi:uncharacterized protein (DUF1501 family)